MDLCLEIHQDMWAQYPDSIEVGEQVFLCAAAIWNTKVMAESSRKMFNGVKDEIWARLAAWAEWANVRLLSFVIHVPLPPHLFRSTKYFNDRGISADSAESTPANSLTTVPTSSTGRFTQNSFNPPLNRRLLHQYL